MANKMNSTELLKSVISDVLGADSSLDQLYSDDHAAWVGVEWRLEESMASHIESAFLKLLVLTEQMELSQLNMIVKDTYSDAKREGRNPGEHKTDPDGDPYLVWSGAIWRFIECLQATVGVEPVRSVSRDLEQLVRACQYAINQKTVFEPPRCEGDVHNRIEAILRCTFPDLRRKPPIDKPVVNFIPDTGIPSLETLIEYKFVDDKARVGTIANEILADTQGYSSPKWSRILFVIYETRRFTSESEWRQLLRSGGLPPSIDVIVLSGEPITGKRRRQASKKARTTKRPKKAD